MTSEQLKECETVKIDSTNFLQFPDRVQELFMYQMLRVADAIKLFDGKYKDVDNKTKICIYYNKAVKWVVNSLKKCNDKIKRYEEEIEEIKKRLVMIACIDKVILKLIKIKINKFDF